MKWVRIVNIIHQALLISALENAKYAEKIGLSKNKIVISCKVSNVRHDLNLTEIGLSPYFSRVKNEIYNLDLRTLRSLRTWSLRTWALRTWALRTLRAL